MELAQMTIVPIEAGLVGAQRDPRHALDTAAHDEVLLTQHHAHRGEVDRLERPSRKSG